MEKRKEKISTHKVCRFCLTESTPLWDLYDRMQTSKDISLRLKILTCVSVEVFPSDKMPCYICSRCNSLMNLFYDYKHIVRQADENILHYIQTGTPLEPIKWSSSLVKASKVCKEVIMKTVVEGGATVQVFPSDSEEEEDSNIYNVKIGDGTDGEEKTACIKVVSAKPSQDMDVSGQNIGFSSVTKLTRHVRGHAGVRPYPCKHCDKSFTKSHHYTRHLRVRHRNETRTSRDEQYRCEQCDITFNTQDELIYHSAIHATQNLTCPLCQEKFHDVDAVTTHIKSHVTGDEFMCDFCELVFTSQEKLQTHLMAAHEEEVQQDAQDESEGMDAEEEYEDNSINVKEVDENNMVIEIKKPEDFMIKGTNETKEVKIEKGENTNSEESEAEAPPNETPAPVTVIKKPPITILSEQTIYKPAETVTSIKSDAPKESPKPPAKKSSTQSLDVASSEEESKPKADQQAEAAPVKKEKPPTKVETSSGVGDKSLRLLEKELQDLKRTTSSKLSGKTTDGSLKSRRPLHTSTPKLKSGEEKKPMKSVIPKKVPTKENKEPKEVREKEPKTNGNDKEDKEKESKLLLKNGGNSSDKSTDEGIRRSTRPSKIKNYAKMVRDKPQAESNDDSEDDDDEEYKEIESRPRGRRSSLKQSPKPSAATAPAATSTATPAATSTATPIRKRGRPRKDAGTPVPAKMKKESEDSDEDKTESASSSKLKDLLEGNKSTNTISEVKPPVLVYPSGQTLKKVPMTALPPGVKPLPLPANARPVTSGDLCEMQIGKKVVKVQKIVMTRAEVEAMAKKGLVEMKDGTMVLKQGIKLPTSDPANIKSTLVGDTTEIPKEPTPKKEIPKATPSRCDLEEV